MATVRIGIIDLEIKFDKEPDNTLVLIPPYTLLITKVTKVQLHSREIRYQKQAIKISLISRR